MGNENKMNIKMPDWYEVYFHMVMLICGIGGLGATGAAPVIRYPLELGLLVIFFLGLTRWLGRNADAIHYEDERKNKPK